MAARIHNAFLRTIEEGIHTNDIFKEGASRAKVGTQEFAQAIVKRLGQKPHTLRQVDHAMDHTKSGRTMEPPLPPRNGS